MAKRRPHAPTTTSTVGVTSNPINFGGTGTVVFTTDQPEPWAKITCYGNDTTIGQNPGVLYTKFLDVFRGNTSFVLSETPSWQGGGATGLVELYLDVDGTHTVIASGSFTVLS